MRTWNGSGTFRSREAPSCAICRGAWVRGPAEHAARKFGKIDSAQLLALSAQLALDPLEQRDEARVTTKSGEEFIVQQRKVPAIVHRPVTLRLFQCIQRRFRSPAQCQR